MKKINVNSLFQATPYSLRLFAADKDARYWNHHKAAKGIVSYKHALSDLIDFFENVKFGRTKPNSKSISYWSYIWGWDWRKTIRFFAHCLAQIETMWASFSVKKWVAKAKKITESVKKSVYRKRGKAFEPIEDINELEAEFAQAMSDIAQPRNPKAYIQKICQNLKNKDMDTVSNFQDWIEKRREEKEKQAEELKIAEFNFKVGLAKIAKAAGIVSYVESGDTLIMRLTDKTTIERTKKEMYYRLVELGVAA